MDGRGTFSLARALGQRLPVALVAWLSVCIGAAIGAGGAVGQRLDRRALGIPSVRDGYLGWQRRGRSGLSRFETGCVRVW